MESDPENVPLLPSALKVAGKLTSFVVPLMVNLPAIS